jgi:hypothetical protein
VAHHWAASHPFAVRVDTPIDRKRATPKVKGCLGHGWQKEVGDIREIKIPNFINLEYREEFSSQLLASPRSNGSDSRNVRACRAKVGAISSPSAHAQRRLTWITERSGYSGSALR